MTLTLTETIAILEVHQRAEASEAEALMEETTPATALAQVRVAEAQAVEEVQTEKKLQLAAVEDQLATENQVATQIQTEEELQVGITAATASDGQMEIRLELLFILSLSQFLSLSTGLPLLWCWQPEEAAGRRKRSAGKTNRRTEACSTEYGN